MELFLELAFLEGNRPVSIDVSLDVDPNDHVHDVTEALAEYAESHGYGPFARDVLSLTIESTGQSLEPTQSVLDTNLLSGQTVFMGHDSTIDGRSRARLQGTVSIDIASGPQAGRFVTLAPGTHTVGRAEDRDVVIADPTLSQNHLTIEVGTDLSVTVTPHPQATNGTFIGAEEITSRRTVLPEELLQVGATGLAFRPLGEDFSRRRDLLGQIPFNRIPHHRSVVRERVFEPLERPPNAPKTTAFPLLAALVPVVAGVLMVMIIGRWQFLLITALSPIMLIGRYVSDRRGGRRSYANDRTAFLERVDERADAISKAVADERRERFEAAPDVAEVAREATFHHGRLWERNRDDPDFLALRLGLSDLPTMIRSEVERGGEQALREQAEHSLRHGVEIQSVPMVLSLDELGVVGLFGDPASSNGSAMSLVIQAACLHSPEDLVIAAVVPEMKTQEFAWLKWLPHTRSATSPLEGPHVAVGTDAANRLLVRLRKTVERRLEEQRGKALLWPRILLLLHEDVQPDRATLSQLLDLIGGAGMTVVWCGQSSQQLPRQCAATVACADPIPGTKSRLRFKDPDTADRDVEIETVSSARALPIARTLAPIRDASAATVTTAIPRRVVLLETLSMSTPEPGEITRRWREDRPYGLRARIGTAADGPFTLDLVSDGPHALIAGTSGAGKSELLQTLVCALAANYPPTRLNFLFIDYKGGAGSSEFRDLPHAVGYVTNLDGRMSIRALQSLRAELSRRMKLLEGRAKDLGEMIEVDADAAPPSLVIVVDEFATLVKEIPDFVAGIVDVAQRGRSLGIHLVLSTQRPAGAVNDNILANTNLRIALRMLDTSDSLSVIDSKEAALIPVPLRGRAYARMGPGPVIGFQSAWSGAPYSPEEGARRVSVSEFELGGPSADASPSASRGKPAPSDPVPTQLQVTVAAMAEGARAMGLPKARKPWVEPLSSFVRLQDMLTGEPPATNNADDAGRYVTFGVVDAPATQSQYPATVDIEAAGGLLVFGTGGTGKTTLLRTVAASLCRQGSAQEIRLYGLDFASRSLTQITSLPQCAAVSTGDDLERVTRIITILEHEVLERRRILSEARAETLSAWRVDPNRAAGSIARIFVLLDGYESFQRAFDSPDTYEWVGRFHRLVADGRQVGIHAVVTTDRRSSVSSALFSSISTRLVLRMADPEDMGILGIPAKIAKEAELAPGRGFLAGAEVQVACVGDDASGAGQARALEELGRELTGGSLERAPQLPELPRAIPLDRLGASASRFHVPLGVADLTLDKVDVDLNRGHFVVIGPARSGRSNALAVIARGARESAPEIPIFGLGGNGSPLERLALCDEAAFERRKQIGLLEELAARATAEGGDIQALLVIDDESDVGEEAGRVLEAVIRLDAVRLVVATEASTFGRAFSGWLGALRRARGMLFLQPEGRADIEQVAGVKTRFRPDQTFPPGRGVLVTGRDWYVVHVARIPGEAVDYSRG